jgi:hypothetical protein
MDDPTSRRSIDSVSNFPPVLPTHHDNSTSETAESVLRVAPTPDINDSTGWMADLGTFAWATSICQLPCAMLHLLLVLQMPQTPHEEPFRLNLR